MSHEYFKVGTTQALINAVKARTAEKPDSDALSPLLTAGAALGITGDGPTDSAAWLQRTSTSDGPTTAKSIHGRTVRWNQLMQNGDFASATGWGGDNATVSVADGILSMSPSESGKQVYGVRSSTNLSGDAQVVGHKYLAIADVKVSRECGILMQRYNTGAYIQVTATNSWVRIADIYTLSTVASGYLVRLNAKLGSGTFDTTDVVQAKNYQIFDLTAMFGAGSEPSTIEEFEALYPQPYYPYDAGSLLPVNMTGIETTAADESWTQQRSIPAGTLRSAGSVYDELTSTEAITRVGVVDLGTLDWRYDTDNGRFNTTVQLPDMARTSYRAETPCAKYVYGAKGAVDKTVFAYNGGIYVYDTAYTDAAAFKAAMSGVMLHYALATPTVTPIDPPLNMTYRTEQGGTERVMVLTGENSAPPTIVAAQGYTAESLRDAALSAIAPVENGLASTNYGVGAYLVHGGQLCKVTTAIATGESITIGTNVTATTVMAEVIALIAQ